MQQGYSTIDLRWSPAVKWIKVQAIKCICDKPAENSWQFSKWLLKQFVINIHSGLQNNFLVRHWPVALVGGGGSSLLKDLIFLADITVVLIFSFSPAVLRPVYNLSNHPNTFVYVCNIAVDFCTSVPAHSNSPLVRKWAFTTVHRH